MTITTKVPKTTASAAGIICQRDGDEGGRSEDVGKDGTDDGGKEGGGTDGRVALRIATKAVGTRARSTAIARSTFDSSRSTGAGVGVVP